MTIRWVIDGCKKKIFGSSSAGLGGTVKKIKQKLLTYLKIGVKIKLAGKSG